GVTAVRSPIYAHHEPMTPREGVRYQFQDQGLQRFTLGLVPHQGSWAEARLTRHSLELNQRPTVLLESYHAGPLPRRASYVSVMPDHLVVGALKVAEHGDDLIVRLVETAGRPAAARVDLPAWDRSFAAEIGAFEIRTFQVPRDVDRAPFEVDLLERPVDPEPAVGQG
ncbi:MAG TPA: glycosyl hydrolase-related protein, partial [Candidatus Saccharimonadales bacterium]|nr:glycosyl hydrolase-related protein [Candidatus Saccharimonadales bacterium]